MTEAPKEAAIRCELCGDDTKPSEIAVVDGKTCCRPCSASIRSDFTLVDQFVSWHGDLPIAEMKMTRYPERTEFRPGLFGAVAEFELPDILGSITMRADGQCDSDALRVSTGEQILCSYAILINPAEVSDHLSATYETIGREQAGGHQPPTRSEST